MSLSNIAVSTRIPTRKVPTASSLASGSWSNLASINICSGNYLVVSYIQYSANTSGVRGCCVSDSLNSLTTQAQRGAYDLTDANPTLTTTVSCSFVIQATQDKTLYLNGYQNSGSSLTVYPALYIIPLD